jgi:hypothetical protein
MGRWALGGGGLRTPASEGSPFEEHSGNVSGPWRGRGSVSSLLPNEAMPRVSAVVAELQVAWTGGGGGEQRRWRLRWPNKMTAPLDAEQGAECTEERSLEERRVGLKRALRGVAGRRAFNPIKRERFAVLVQWAGGARGWRGGYLVAVGWGSR